jgi:imidazolonepropionase-like amidohydrolase
LRHWNNRADRLRRIFDRGSIHAGQLADLVVLEGDPTKNVGALGKCASS